MRLSKQILTIGLCAQSIDGFVVKPNSHVSLMSKLSNLWSLNADAVDTSETSSSTPKTTDEISEERRQAKAALLGLIGNDNASSTSNLEDPVLADPVTKEGLKLISTGTVLGGQGTSGGKKVSLTSTDNAYSGRTDTYYNLLRAQETDQSSSEDGSKPAEEKNALNSALSSLQVFIPPPLRPVLSMSGVLPGYIPMRDLFTSPSVSFAYERGWRQGFASAGFPGADKEYEMVKEFFAPLNPQTVVDMSCATGKLYFDLFFWS